MLLNKDLISCSNATTISIENVVDLSTIFIQKCSIHSFVSPLAQSFLRGSEPHMSVQMEFPTRLSVESWNSQAILGRRRFDHHIPLQQRLSPHVASCDDLVARFLHCSRLEWCGELTPGSSRLPALFYHPPKRTPPLGALGCIFGLSLSSIPIGGSDDRHWLPPGGHSTFCPGENSKGSSSRDPLILPSLRWPSGHLESQQLLQ